MTLAITADEETLEKLAALLLFAKIEPRVSLDGPSPLSPDPSPEFEPVADLTAAREEALGLLREYIERHGLELGKNLLAEFGVSKISELTAVQLAALLDTLKKSLRRS